MRAIDADALKEELKTSRKWEIVADICLRFFLITLEKMPEATIENIVHCKDCRWYKNHNRCLLDVDKEGKVKSLFPDREFFCAAGARKSDF